MAEDDVINHYLKTQLYRGQAPCPQCQINLKKTHFREQMFDDPAVDKEVFVRRKLLKIYNKRESDFTNGLNIVFQSTLPCFCFIMNENGLIF